MAKSAIRQNGCATYKEHDDKEHEEEQSATKVAFKNNNNQADAP